MKKVFLKKGALSVEALPIPSPGPKEVVVANAYSVVSKGTESQMIQKESGSLLRRALLNRTLLQKGFQKLREEGIKSVLHKIEEKESEVTPLGYSSAGVVIELGNEIADLSVGDRVACGGAEYAHHGEVITVPRNLLALVPSEVDLKHAAFATIGAIGIQGLRRAQPQFGETIAIIGLGLIGLITLQVAVQSGITVIGIDIDEEALSQAKRFGAASVFKSGEADLKERVLHATHGFGVDAALMYAATPSSDPLNLALSLCRHKGTVVAIGECGMNIDRELMYKKELNLLMSTSTGPGRYDDLYEKGSIDYPIGYVRWTENRNMRCFLDYLKEGKIDVEPFISGCHSLEEAPRIYATLPQLKGTPVFQYDPQRYTSAPSPLRKRIVVVTKEKDSRTTPSTLHLGIIGTGEFFTRVRLPHIKRKAAEGAINVVGIADRNVDSLTTIGNTLSSDFTSGDYRDVIKDDRITCVWIATPHNLHYPMVLEALREGKHVFVEKPLCLTEKEMDEILETAQEKNCEVIVGFNRRHSPYIQYIKQHLSDNHGPVQILCRCNAGFIPADHWIQKPEIGGGRIIGECCHFFNLFHYLAGKGKEVVSLSVNAIPPDDRSIATRDNLSVTLRYSDGSLATLVYTSLGNKQLPKEYYEIYQSGRVLVLNDFLELRTYGADFIDPQSPKLKRKGTVLISQHQEKGFEEECDAFCEDILKGRKESITLPETIDTMTVTFKVHSYVLSNRHP